MLQNHEEMMFLTTSSLRKKSGKKNSVKSPGRNPARHLTWTTKGDLVLAALRKLAVSNATLTDAEPQSGGRRRQRPENDGMAEMALAVMRHPVSNVGYIFADADVAPEIPGDEHGSIKITLSMPSFSTCLPHCPDYALEASAKLITTARYGKERLVKLSAMDRAKSR